jgi:opacity protein-like surface antigen
MRVEFNEEAFARERRACCSRGGARVGGGYEPRAAPLYTKAAMMAPLYDWTGFYIGGHAACSWTHSDGQTMNLANGLLFTPSSSNSSAFHGGGQIGYDYMLPSRIVLGVVGTLSSGSQNSSTNIGFQEINTTDGKTETYSPNIDTPLPAPRP